jgi:hypothetical protein
MHATPVAAAALPGDQAAFDHAGDMVGHAALLPATPAGQALESQPPIGGFGEGDKNDIVGVGQVRALL